VVLSWSYPSNPGQAELEGAHGSWLAAVHTWGSSYGVFTKILSLIIANGASYIQASGVSDICLGGMSGICLTG
jgi:hypothetical protein